MEQTFALTVNRQKLVTILGVCTVVSFVTRIMFFFLLKPNENPTFLQNVIVPLIDNLTATFIVSLVIATTYLLLKPEEELLKLLVKKSQIDEELKISKLNTNEWLFSGGTGSETRKITIPFLAGQKNYNKHTTVRLQIINPKNNNLCEEYSKYRVKKNSQSKDWTKRQVQLKIYSTILSCMYWSEVSDLTIEVYLRNSFSTLRYDISDDRIIITKEDPNSPAYLVKKPNSFFYAIALEFKLTLNQTEKLDFSMCSGKFKTIFNSENFTKDNLKDAFSLIKIYEEFTDEEFKYIMENAKPDKISN